MKLLWKLSTFAIILGVLFSLLSFSSPLSAADDGQGNLPSERLIVKFKPGTSSSDIAEVHKRVGANVEATISQIGVQVVTIPGGQRASKIASYSMQREVSYVEVDSVAQAADVPNDTYFNLQWGLTKVKAPQAWDITKGSGGVVIAILDSGIDVNHPDLAGKIVSSVNFTDSTTPYANGQSHGTHVAGIAAAITNNGIGVAGLGRNCSLMNVKVLGDNGYGYYSWIAQGIIWAADHGAEVINLSLGGSSASSTLENAVNYAWGKGVLVVAAAGNNGSTSAFYPAYYTNCIAVGATDSNDALATWSNHGSWVDVAAPGVSIYSCMPDNQYDYKSGTSMASPYVAGLGGLVFSVANDANGDGKLNDEVRSAIEASCDNVSVDVAYGRINAYRAVQMDSSPPTPTPTPTPTPVPTPTPTPTPTPRPTPTPVPTATPTPTPTTTPTPTPVPTATPTPTPVPTPTPTPTPRPTATPTPTPRPTATPTPTPVPTPTPIPTLVPTATPTPTPRPTATPTPTPVPTATPTPTPVPTIMVNMDAPDFAAEDSVFIVRVNVTGVIGFYSADYEIVFNPSVFEVGNVTNGQIDSTLIPVDTWQVVTPGVIRVVQNAEELHGVSGSGYIVELHFHVIGLNGNSSEIDFSNGIFNDVNANQMPATWTGKASIEVYESGDANNDGSVNSLDILKLERIIMGLDNLTPGADANGDGNVNALDITKVEMVIMGK